LIRASQLVFYTIQPNDNLSEGHPQLKKKWQKVVTEQFEHGGIEI